MAAPRRSWLWGGLGLSLLAGLWQAGHLAYGGLILPGIGETVLRLAGMITRGVVAPALGITALHALMGWAIGALVGVGFGTLAGLRGELRAMLQPVAVLFLGVPAIAWVVMALLWFGGDMAVVFTVAVASAPLSFAAAVEGVESLDPALARMARAFRVPLLARSLHLYAPHMLSHLFPVLTSTLAMAWKLAVMAELLAGAGGVGDGIATARVQVDTAATMAWVLVLVAVLIVVDRGVLGPLGRYLWRWRDVPEGQR
ncbi:MAG: ABC transporter permease subunit [Maritimibacter sp.]|jgi:NitT/TauT family transport system permease protein